MVSSFQLVWHWPWLTLSFFCFWPLPSTATTRAPPPAPKVPPPAHPQKVAILSPAPVPAAIECLSLQWMYQLLPNPKILPKVQDEVPEGIQVDILLGNIETASKSLHWVCCPYKGRTICIWQSLPMVPKWIVLREETRPKESKTQSREAHFLGISLFF